MAIAVAPALPVHRLDVYVYERMVDSGALEGLAVELLEGLLVDKDSSREDPLHRLDVGTFERMVASGALEGEPVELLEGLLVEVSPQGPEHALIIEKLTSFFAGAHVRLRVQLPLEAAWSSLPEPDLLLTEDEPVPGRHPRTALLAVEVAVSSHERDRDAKASMYARVPVPTYWLVDVLGKAVEVRTDPGPDGYRRCETYGLAATVPSPAPGVADLDVGALLEGIGG